MMIKNSAIRQTTYNFLFDFHSNYICLFHAVSSQHDEKKVWIQLTKKVAMVTSSEGSKKNKFMSSSTAKVLPNLQVFYRSVRYIHVEQIILREITKNK